MTAWASMVGKAPSSTRSTSVQREAMAFPHFIRFIVTTSHRLTAVCFEKATDTKNPHGRQC